MGSPDQPRRVPAGQLRWRLSWRSPTAMTTAAARMAATALTPASMRPAEDIEMNAAGLFDPLNALLTPWPSRLVTRNIPHQHLSSAVPGWLTKMIGLCGSGLLPFQISRIARYGL